MLVCFQNAVSFVSIITESKLPKYCFYTRLWDLDWMVSSPARSRTLCSVYVWLPFYSLAVSMTVVEIEIRTMLSSLFLSRLHAKDLITTVMALPPHSRQERATSSGPSEL